MTADFVRVYEDHVWHVYGFFAYRLGSRVEAEDLTQLTFERALRAWERYDPARATARTWLLAIARNVLIDHYRRDHSGRHEPIDDVEALETVTSVSSGEQALGIDADLERALATLGRREREVIALRFGGDLTGPELAELLDLRLATVQQILPRSLRRLRAELERDHEAPAPAARVDQG